MDPNSTSDAILSQESGEMGTSSDALHTSVLAKFDKAMGHLRFSVAKAAPLKNRPLETLSEDELETLEGLAGRFARASDIASRRLMRLLVLMRDPDFDGSTRDLFDLCEKRGLISSADRWMALRKLRNVVAHEYEESALVSLYAALFDFVQDLEDFRSRL